MTYQLRFLKKENDLNKLIKSNKKDNHPINILFVSLWDDFCESLISKIKTKYGGCDKGPPLYVVDSFHMPHSFVIYNTTKLPQLVRLTRKGVNSEDYLPMIMKTLKVK